MGSHTRSRDPVPISSHFRPLDIVPNRDRQLILPSTQELSKGVKWLEERGSSSKKLPYPVPAAPLHMKVVCLTRIMTDLITAQPSGLVEGWTHGNVYFGWSYVVPAFRTASVAVFREHKGIDWFYAVSSVLKRRLGLGDETGILEAFEPAITDVERKSLGDLGFGESPEEFGDESRNRTKVIISSSAEN